MLFKEREFFATDCFLVGQGIVMFIAGACVYLFNDFLALHVSESLGQDTMKYIVSFGLMILGMNSIVVMPKLIRKKQKAKNDKSN